MRFITQEKEKKAIAVNLALIRTVVNTHHKGISIAEPDSGRGRNGKIIAFFSFHGNAKNSTVFKEKVICFAVKEVFSHLRIIGAYGPPADGTACRIIGKGEDGKQQSNNEYAEYFLHVHAILISWVVAECFQCVLAGAIVSSTICNKQLMLFDRNLIIIVEKVRRRDAENTAK